jgi:hypothetical protein
MDRACRTNGRKGMHIRYWLEIQKERGHSEDVDVGGRMILKWILEIQDEMVWTGVMWFRIGTSDGFDSRQGQDIFLYSTASGPAPGPSQPPTR